MLLRRHGFIGVETFGGGIFGNGSFGGGSLGDESLGVENLGVAGDLDVPKPFLALTPGRFFAVRVFLVGASEHTDLKSKTDLKSEQTDLVSLNGTNGSSTTDTLSFLQFGASCLLIEVVSLTESRLLILMRPGLVFSFSPSL